MTRSQDIRRIEAAITHKDESEVRWALAEWELRKQHSSGQNKLWDRLEKRIRAALTETGGRSS